MKIFLIIVYLFISIALIITILLHSPKGEGIGGIGGQARIFKNPQKGLEAGLDKATYLLASLFFILAIVLGLFISI